ncbi:SDR family NAD(P)-dependent oxidoreductase [Novosphingobium sp. M1R2S20]|uniref:SDR family NAD(P)-dependent oxidoreductase n=1 Tax=Novosphingobium rhizovicinum TaxID=3228928 RepID=A0ABV3REV1_9SPHN
MVDTPKVAVITGASSGIGKQAAKELAAQGWRIIGVGRDEGRCAAAEQEVRSVAAGADVTMLRADMSLLKACERLAEDIAGLTDRIHVLLNNAGGMASEKVMTAEGFEQNFASNHLGPFVLTNRLLPLLEKAAADAEPGTVRIINTSSDASEMIPSLNLSDMQNLGNWSVGAAYCSGKLANVLHAKALARRLASKGIVAHSFHPGMVDSNFFSHASEQTQAQYEGAPKRTVEEGADTAVWLATSPDGACASGTYWYERAPRDPHALARDDAFVDQFWDASIKLTETAPSS